MLGLVVALLLIGSWLALVVVLALFLPAAMVLGGIATIKTQLYWHQPVFRPLRLLTGERAVRRGWMLVGAGVLVLSWLLLQAVRFGLALF